MSKQVDTTGSPRNLASVIGLLALSAVVAVSGTAKAEAIDLSKPRGAGNAKGSYTVVVGAETYAMPPWREVVDALRQKYDGSLIVYSGAVGSAREALAVLAPRYACFVARPEEAGRMFVVSVHLLTRALDDDPYTDLLWGILSGYEPEDALRIAKRTEPLIIKRGLSATSGVGLGAFEEGIQFNESRAGGRWVKGPDGKVREEEFPVDSTKGIVDALVDFKPQAFYTSGHAGERDWYIGYTYADGGFTCKDGQLLAKDTKGVVYEINSPNPKVFMPVGNCSIGHIPGERDCMALAMMRTGGAYQMFGYTASTFFGYMGWGINAYFSRYTLAESFYCNNQALVHALAGKYPDAAGISFASYEEAGVKKVKEKVTSDEEFCMLWDRDIVAFYGDPAWEARYPPHAGNWDYSLTREDGVYTLKVGVNADGDWSSRPLMIFLPERIRNVEVTGGEELKPVVTDNFVLLPLQGQRRKGEEISIEFKADPVAPRNTSAKAAPIKVN